MRAQVRCKHPVIMIALEQKEYRFTTDMPVTKPSSPRAATHRASPNNPMSSLLSERDPIDSHWALFPQTNVKALL